MNRQIRGKLINFFKQLIQAELAMNQEKAYLTTFADYHPSLLAQKLAGTRSVITISNFKTYLENKVACNPRELYHIFENFDHTRIGAIATTQFNQEMLPFGHKQWKKVKQGAKVSTGIESGFLKLISVLLRSCRVLDTWRQQLKQCPVYQIFKQMDGSVAGVLGVKDLQAWFLKNGEQLNDQQTKLLYFSLLRRHYPSLNLEVLCENLSPMEWGGYKAYRDSLLDEHTREAVLKQEQCLQAIAQEHHYYQQINNHMNVSEVHRQASLNRQMELQQRVQKELRSYQEMKYLTRKRYHPGLTYTQFVLMQREEKQREQSRKEAEVREAIRAEAEYREKIKRVEVGQEVQNFFNRRQLVRSQQNSLNRSNSPNKNYLVPLDYNCKKQELQEKVKKHRLQLGLESLNFRHLHR